MRKVLKKGSLLLIVLSLFFASANFKIFALNDNGQLLYVDFNENVEDKSGNGNNGIIQGDPEYVDGIKGKALQHHPQR